MTNKNMENRQARLGRTPHLQFLIQGWFAVLIALTLHAEQQSLQSFDVDPQWEGFRNRLVPEPPPMTRQTFAYRDSHRAQGVNKGEIGGWVQRSTTPAWYAKVIEPVTLTNRLSASGRFVVTHCEGGSGVLFGWFNSQSRGWRMPNSLVFRVDGNGNNYWVFFEYGTRHWLTGGGETFEGGRYQTTKTKPFVDGTSHAWRFEYRPKGDAAELEFVIDGKSYIRPVPAEHVRDGAVFDRFGIVNQQTTGDGMELYFDDLEMNGERFAFDCDPAWEAKGNEVKFRDRVRRPFHDFGFSATANAGQNGEIGGVIWRDERPAYYGMPITPVTFEQPFSASGKIAFCGAGSDSAVYLGFFDSAAKRNKKLSDYQAPTTNLLAVFIEGPSRIGHYFRAGYRNSSGEGMFEDSGPTIQPDGRVHAWALRYTPNAGDEDGVIEVTFDGQTQRTRVRKDHKRAGASFDRFGFTNIQAGGHYVEIYVDDLTLTPAPVKRVQ
jgi:hypothetical protein